MKILDILLSSWNSIYELDYMMDNIFKKHIKELEIIKITRFYIYFIYGKYIYKVWNENQWYGWLHTIMVYDENGINILDLSDVKISGLGKYKFFNKIKKSKVTTSDVEWIFPDCMNYILNDINEIIDEHYIPPYIIAKLKKYIDSDSFSKQIIASTELGLKQLRQEILNEHDNILID